MTPPFVTEYYPDCENCCDGPPQSGGSGTTIYSGSGSGTPAITVPCCPYPVPLTIHCTISSTCSLINGLTIACTYNPTTGCWEGYIDGLPCTDCSRFSVSLCCSGTTWSGGGGFGQGPSDPLPCVSITSGSPSFNFVSCSPLYATYTGSYKSVGSPTSCCNNFSFTLIFTA